MTGIPMVDQHRDPGHPEPGHPDPRRLALGVLMPGFATVDDEVHRLVADGLGGVCLFGANTTGGPDAVAELVTGLRVARPDLVVAVDEEGGDVTRLHAHDATGSPVVGHAALGAAGDPALSRATGRAIGAELRALGIDLCLGPVADLNTDPDNPVIGTRSFGTDPARAAAHVAAWVTGLREAGAAACVKHFPGHGDTRTDSHLALPELDVDAETLAVRELAPFVAALGAGCEAVMTGHLVVPALDPDGLPASLSPAVGALLRDRLGPDRVVVTDALDMAGASVPGGVPAAAVTALRAGADLLCLGADVPPAVVRAVQDAVAAQVPVERLAEAAGRAATLRRAGAPPAGPPLDRDAQRAGARRAVRVDGGPADLDELGGAFLVRVTTPGTIAVGDGPWGLPADLDVDPGPDTADTADAVRRAAGERPVVVQVRDAHRRPEVLALLERLGGPTVVDYGWPGPWPAARAGGSTRIATHGWSGPSGAVVAELLGRAR